MQLRTAIVRSLTLFALAGSLVTVQVAQADDDLSGPKVKDNSVPGNNRKLSQTGPKERGEPRPASVRQFIRALESLKADSTPAELRLTADQESTIQGFRTDFDTKMTAYRDANKAEVLALRQDVGPREQRRIDEMLRGPDGERGPRGEKGDKAQPGDMTPPPDGMMDDSKPVDVAKAEAARNRLKEIFEAAPKPTEVQAAVMGVLTEDQKQFVRSAMEKAEERKGRGEGERGEEMWKNLPEAEREKIKNMTPEERREYLRENMQKRGEGKRGNKQAK